MKVGKLEVINREFYFFGYTVLLTQYYNAKNNTGHYKYVVHRSNNANKTVIAAGSTTGGPPRNMVDQDLAKRIYTDARHDWEDFVKTMAEDSKEAMELLEV